LSTPIPSTGYLHPLPLKVIYTHSLKRLSTPTPSRGYLHPHHLEVIYTRSL
ncbi:predicted protein, partial [Nematostella vectensis]